METYISFSVGTQLNKCSNTHFFFQCNGVAVLFLGSFETRVIPILGVQQQNIRLEVSR